MCAYCGGTWAYTNTSRVIRHLVPTYPAGTGIARCVHSIVKFDPQSEKRWEEFAETSTALYHRRRTSNDTASKALQERTYQIADSIAVSGSSKRLKRSDDDTLASAERRNHHQMLLPASMYQNGDRLTAAIANFVHSEGLPFSVVDKPTFHYMLREARYAPAKYKMPDRKLVGGNLLDVTYETYFAHNLKKLNIGIEMFGICLYGDSATIRRKPFLNILAACVKEPSIVLEITDATSHLETGEKKDASYGAEQFIPWMKKLDPENKFLDCVFFDGAGDVQKAGKILAAKNPRIAVRCMVWSMW
jgi:hypothetical protein